MKGHPKDEENNKFFKSQVVKSNGFNPQWNEVIEYELYLPEFAFLKFEAFDYDFVGREKLGWNAVPVSGIRSGYRALPLLDDKLVKIKFSYLFLKIEKEFLLDR